MDGIMKCEKGQCIVGRLGSQMVTAGSWDDELKLFKFNMEAFNNNEATTIHPGFIYQCHYCPSCGTKIIW